MMSLLGSGGPPQTATEALLNPYYYSRTDDLHNISSNEYNLIKTELQVLRIDFDRIYNGYKQLGIAHAELLLDQQKEWREFLLDSVYVGTLHPDVRDDVITLLETIERQSKLKGVVK